MKGEREKGRKEEGWEGGRKGEGGEEAEWKEALAFSMPHP